MLALLRQKKLLHASARVKSVDLHAHHPWMLTGCYDGSVVILNYKTGAVVKKFEIGDTVIRAARFIPGRDWVVTGSDDMTIRIWNTNTFEVIEEVKDAHADYIRYIEPHPSAPCMLSCADDMTIRLWTWTDSKLKMTRAFEGHSHYVMMVRWNPKDSNTFASASLDRTIKVWSMTTSTPFFTLEGHANGVNAVGYYLGGDKPYMVSGADDFNVKVWDYQTRTCVATLKGHTSNVTAVGFHPRMPVLFSCSEDGTVRLWNDSTHRLEKTLTYGLDRCWAAAVQEGSSALALGYDGGSVLLTMGSDTPVASMDHNGRVVMSSNTTLSLGAVRDVKAEDGEKITLALRELGTSEVFPVSIAHNSNGRFIAVSSDSEYVVYTAQALRNRAFGEANQFVWSSEGSGDFATRHGSASIVLHKNFEAGQSIRPPFACDKIFGGHLLAATGADAVVFYDWETGTPIRQIDESPTAVYWSSSGEFCALVCAEVTYILAYDAAAVAAAKSSTVDLNGVAASFELLHEFEGKVASACWVEDVLLYTTTSGRVAYFVGGETLPVATAGTEQHLLGYLPREGRAVCMDIAGAIVTYQVSKVVMQYHTAVMRKDFHAANALLPRMPPSSLTDVARFLEAQGYKEEAMAVTQDPEHRFELALQLKQLETALQVMQTDLASDDSADTTTRWRSLTDLALAIGNIPVAQRCAELGSDLSTMLLLHSCLGNQAGMAKLAEDAARAGRVNIAWTALMAIGDAAGAVELLVAAKRPAEAALLARTYSPDVIDAVMPMWKAELQKTSRTAATALASPASNPDQFPGIETSKAAAQQVEAAGPRDAALAGAIGGMPAENTDAVTALDSSGTTIAAWLEKHGYGVSSPAAVDRSAPAVEAPSPAAASPVASESPASPAPSPAVDAAASPSPQAARAMPAPSTESPASSPDLPTTASSIVFEGTSQAAVAPPSPMHSEGSPVADASKTSSLPAASPATSASGTDGFEQVDAAQTGFSAAVTNSATPGEGVEPSADDGFADGEWGAMQAAAPYGDASSDAAFPGVPEADAELDASAGWGEEEDLMAAPAANSSPSAASPARASPAAEEPASSPAAVRVADANAFDDFDMGDDDDWGAAATSPAPSPTPVPAAAPPSAPVNASSAAVAGGDVDLDNFDVDLDFDIDELTADL